MQEKRDPDGSYHLDFLVSQLKPRRTNSIFFKILFAKSYLSKFYSYLDNSLTLPSNLQV